MLKSYTTKSNALRALKNICAGCVKHAKEIIQEVDGKFVFDEDKVEELMTRKEWAEVYENDSNELPDETITEADEEELAAAIDAEEEVIVLTRHEPSEVNAAAVLLGASGVMNTAVCPNCGSEELYTGRNDKGLVVDEDKIIGCHHCDWQVDTRKSGHSKQAGVARDAMKTSLKLDRTITCVETNEVWKNAFQMWKEHTDWMTSAQQDRLTAVLYKAAKQGDQEIVTINGRHFQLVNVA